MRMSKILSVLAIGVILLGACAAPSPPPAPAETPAPAPTPTPTPELPTEITKSGILAEDETWSGEIFIPDTVRVPQGVTLTIDPGTVIKFRHSRDYKNLRHVALLVNGGTLRAIGTPEEPIWFTSDAEEPINGDWEEIAIEDSKGENIIKYSIVEYASIGIRFWTSSGTVANSIVRWINAEGIYMERARVVVENNTIYGTGYNGIAMEQFNDVFIKNNKIINNQGSGIHGEATKAVIENNIVSNSKVGITFDDLCEVVLRNNLIENIRNEALHFYFNCTGNLLFNEIRNSGIGISSWGSKLTANNNDIYNNTKNIEINSMQEVDLKQNWWGTTNKNEIKRKIFSDTEIPFEPFLTEESVDFQEPVFDYQDVRKTELGYIPGDPEDEYPYIYSDEDETRRVVKKICGEKEGFGEYGFGWSLAWDGKYLWRDKHAGSCDLIKIDPETCEIVASLKNPGIAQDRGIAFDGKSLWVNDFTQKKVFEIDPETGKILSSFRIPEMGSGSSGIAWDGQYLYLVDWLKRLQPGAPLYKVDRQGNLIGVVKLEKGGGASITFDGQHFWVSPSGKGIRKYDKHGKLVGEIYAAAFAGEAIAHDGKYLWVLHRTQELWNDPKLYKIEVIDDQLLLSGARPQPAPTPTPEPEEAVPEVILYEEDFETGTAKGWELHPDWDVELVDGDYALCSSAQCSGVYWSSVFLGAPGWSDYNLETRVKVNSGHFHICFRKRNQYMYWIGVPRKPSVSCYLNKFIGQFVQGQRPPLASLPISLEQNKWYTFRIALKGTNTKVYLDDELIINYTDTNDPIMSGSFGFEAGLQYPGQYKVCFDDIKVTGPMPTPEQEGILFQDDFEDGRADEWDLQPGWGVKLEDGNYVLSGSGHSWAVPFVGWQRDYTIETEAKLVSGSFHFNFRYALAGPTRYFCRVDRGGLSLSKQIGEEFWHSLAGFPMPLELNRWYTIKIVVAGPDIKIYVDEELKIHYTDKDNPILMGMFSFETLDNSHAYFDDIIMRGGIAE